MLWHCLPDRQSSSCSNWLLQLCPAGIDATNIGSIFEEHVVLSQLDPFKPINCSFGLRDRVFNFGTVIAQLADADTASLDVVSTGAVKGERKGGSAKGTAKSAARPSLSNPGMAATVAVAAAGAPNQGSLLDEPCAVKANLKFINPIKVPCTVNFLIKPRGGVQPGELPHGNILAGRLRMKVLAACA